MTASSDMTFESYEFDLPPSVWILDDSNTDLFGVPECVQDLCQFIVQVAFPQRDHLNWRLKEVGVCQPEYSIS